MAADPRVRLLVRKPIEALLLVVGMLLLTGYAAARINSLLTTRALLEAFSRAEVSASGSAGLETLPGGEAAVAEGGAEMPRHAAAEMPLAVLTIPKIHLRVPVLEGTDALTLNHAAGRIAGTALPGETGNIGIAAHRDSFFRNLGKMKAGDAIELETTAGVKTYIVEQTQIVTPDDVAVLDPRGSPSLTLVTCYPFHYLGRAPQRYIVTASLAR